MALDCLLADDQHFGDLIVGVRLSDELDDLLFARREEIAVDRLARPRAFQILAHERADAAGIQERLSAHRSAARLDQIAVDGALDVAGRADPYRFEEVLLVVMHREHQDPDVRLADG